LLRRTSNAAYIAYQLLDAIEKSFDVSDLSGLPWITAVQHDLVTVFSSH